MMLQKGGENKDCKSFFLCEVEKNTEYDYTKSIVLGNVPSVYIKTYSHLMVEPVAYLQWGLVGHVPH